MAAEQNGYHKSHPDLNRDLTMDSGAETQRVAQNVWTERKKKKVFGFQGERPADCTLQRWIRQDSKA